MVDVGDAGGARPLALGVAGQGDGLAVDARVADQGALDALAVGGVPVAGDGDGAAARSGVGQTDVGVGGGDGAALTALDAFFERGHAATDVGEAGSGLRLGDVVLVGRQRDGGEDGDDRDDDHQFDQGETLLLLHGNSLGVVWLSGASAWIVVGP